jgi:hypothetical protein
MPRSGRVSGILLCLLPALLVSWPSVSAADAADALENAYFVCDVFEKTGISSECQVAHVVREVEVSIDTSEAEAEQVCTLIARTLVEKKRFFGGGWKLLIRSPQRAAPLAECALR